MNISRRAFLKTSAAGGTVFTIGFAIPLKQAQAASNTSGLAINAYIRIAEDNSITLVVDKPEMGQGTFTSQPMILAEELDADWKQLKIEHAKLPGSDFPWIGVGGSNSVKSSFMALRQAGANTRAMLLQAAAAHWGTDESTLRTENSHVINANGERLPYGKLITSAAQLPVPQNAPLKPSEQFKLIGKDVLRTESQEKVTGRALFGIDAQMDDMHYASIARPPIFGAKLKSVDDAAAKKMPGVIKIKTIPAGVAVIADSFWRAKKARDALSINWDLGDWQHHSTEQLKEEYRQQADKSTWRPRKLGNIGAARARADKILNMTYELPFLAHAAMEPLNCTVHDRGDGAEIWTSSQFPSAGQNNAAKILGYSPDQVVLNNAFMGGGFGRRGATDFVEDAAHIAKGEPWPVKVIWTREEDIQGGYYRPMVTHKARLSLNDAGRLTAFENTTVGQVYGGIHEIAYHIPNQQFGAHKQKSPVPTHFWRSVDHSHTAFAIESAIDEAATTAQRDPIAYRRELLQKQPRILALLDKVEQMSGWDKPLPKHNGLGVAIHASFNSIVAQVAQVKVTGGEIKVENVWCAVDCGFAVNPLNVKAQMESAIIYGLSAALFGEITFNQGKVMQSNFHDYPVVRMEHSPTIEVAIINSGADLGGIGEPGLPPIAPAVANALFAATGERLRTLPFKLGA